MIKRVKYYIISGRVIEERHTTLSARSCDSFKKRRAPRRAGASSERKIAANEQEAVRRLARLINCNFGRGDIFLLENTRPRPCQKHSRQPRKK